MHSNSIYINFINIEVKKDILSNGLKKWRKINMKQPIMTVAYIKSFELKSQFDRHFESKAYESCTILLNFFEVFYFVTNIRHNFCKTVSIFYHSIHIWYYDIMTNHMIFGVHLHFIEFKTYSVTRSYKCFADKIFEFSFQIFNMGSNWTPLHEYQLFQSL